MYKTRPNDFRKSEGVSVIDVLTTNSTGIFKVLKNLEIDKLW